MSEPLDFALIKRLREVRDRRPATETELRTLKEQAEGWQRASQRAAAGERAAVAPSQCDPASSLAQIASELRRVERLQPQLDEVRSLLGISRTEPVSSGPNGCSRRRVGEGSSRRPGGRRP